MYFPTRGKWKFTTFFSINGENSPGSCIMKYYFMKYDILVPNFHWFENNIAKKLAQKLENFFFVKIHFRLYYKKKKWHGPLSHWCREGKTLVVRPLKKNTFFMCVFPYPSSCCLQRTCLPPPRDSTSSPSPTPETSEMDEEEEDSSPSS